MAEWPVSDLKIERLCLNRSVFAPCMMLQSLQHSSRCSVRFDRLHGLTELQAELQEATLAVLAAQGPQHLTQLRSLSVDTLIRRAEHLSQLVPLGLTSLEELSIQGVFSGPTTATLQPLSALPSLTSLVIAIPGYLGPTSALSRGFCRDSELKHIARGLPQLRSLSLGGWQLGAAGLVSQTEATALLSLPQLTRLELRNCDVSNDLPPVIRRLPGLLYLETDCKAIAQAFGAAEPAPSPCRLTNLVLWRARSDFDGPLPPSLVELRIGTGSRKLLQCFKHPAPPGLRCIRAYVDTLIHNAGCELLRSSRVRAVELRVSPSMSTDGDVAHICRRIQGALEVCVCLSLFRRPDPHVVVRADPCRFPLSRLQRPEFVSVKHAVVVLPQDAGTSTSPDRMPGTRPTRQKATHQIIETLQQCCPGARAVVQQCERRSFDYSYDSFPLPPWVGGAQPGLAELLVPFPEELVVLAGAAAAEPEPQDAAAPEPAAPDGVLMPPPLQVPVEPVEFEEAEMMVLDLNWDGLLDDDPLPDFV